MLLPKAAVPWQSKPTKLLVVRPKGKGGTRPVGS